MKTFNFEYPVAYAEAPKVRFHNAARKALKAVAALLELPAGSYEIRSNKAGVAVSGEITLHGERIYIQVSQSCMGANMGVLIRSCKGRRDYTGGQNNFLPLHTLNTPFTIAHFAQKIM